MTQQALALTDAAQQAQPRRKTGRKQKTFYAVGQRVGPMVVVAKIHGAIYELRCDCGVTVRRYASVLASAERMAKSESAKPIRCSRLCGVVSTWNRVPRPRSAERVADSLLYRLRKAAESRGHEVTLSIAYVVEIRVDKQCHYCAGEIGMKIMGWGGRPSSGRSGG